MLVNFGRASLIEKARAQPDKVRQVLDKARADGILATVHAVRSKLAQPIPLGYSNAGVVIAVGRGVSDILVGDRVVSNGAHSTHVRVPRNLCARIPENVSDEAAAFTIVASIGLQGIRLAAPTLGESFVVTGAGLIGLLTIQLLRAQGCRVLAIDLDPRKLALAKQFGAKTCNPAQGEDPISAGLAFSRADGVDGVIVTATTRSSDLISQAAQMCRKRGRIVLVGVTGLDLDRSEFYEKELTFQVSCSYGPGRYDPQYEERGVDYPLGFVRWTEGRNFEAVLDMLADGRLRTEALVSGRFPFDRAGDAYRMLNHDKSALGLLLQYPDSSAEDERRKVILLPDKFDRSQPVLGFIGAGNYASRVLIPSFKTAGAQLHSVATSGGLGSAIAATRHGFSTASSDADAILSDGMINTVAIVTRHDTHARFTADALRSGKHVFVEKPLALTMDELDTIETAFCEAHSDASGPQLMVGFNRRFAPLVLLMKKLVASVETPKSFLMLMNAGAIPSDHWTQDADVGGGRIIGEACHHIDLMRHLAGSPIVAVQGRRMGSPSRFHITEDKASITLGFADGSFGTILYVANGARNFPKERIEIFADGRTLQLDNFRTLIGYSWPGFRRRTLLRQDKGQSACVAAFIESIRTGKPAIPPQELFEVAGATIQAAEVLRSQQ
jgi:predicted dehydrogenase/threonine dehydrogenase-like Zn-dependent dehydrogenase